MRLRVTVRRHGLPDTPIIWVIDINAAPTVFQLLEQINAIIPIESDGEWGLDDYAVELKGVHGTNYECLHFQPVASVMKDEDEVLIRPLLSQDIKIRRISGRRQISSSGAHLLDGVVFGRPLLRLSDRPAINIPPRKKRRITYEEEDSTQDLQAALESQRTEETQNDDNRQVVLYADFDDEDSEEDEDFAPPDEDEDEDEDLEGDSEDDDDEREGDDHDNDLDKEEQVGSPINEIIEPCLSGIKDPTTRAKIRKLHAAFPSTKLGVCRHVMEGTGYDVGSAYDALLTGFNAVQPKSAVTETSQGEGELNIPKTRTKIRNSSTNQPEVLDDLQAEPEGSPNPMINHYDQNGLPPGSIASGKALSFMADALKGPPSRHRSESRRSSVVSNKSVRFALDQDTTNGLGSNPAIEQPKDREGDSDDSSEEDSSSDDDSSEVSSDSSDEEMENGSEASSSDSDSDSSDVSSDSSDEEMNNGPAESSCSESHSDSSSDSSSDEDEPEEKSSKKGSSVPFKFDAKSVLDLGSTISSKPKSTQFVAPPGNGTQATRMRNDRRKRADALKRYKNKGILPENTTMEEFKLLSQDQLSSPEIAAAALEALRAAQAAAEADNTITVAAKRLLLDAENFELRRKELLASIAQGGIEAVDPSAKKAKSSSTESSDIFLLAPRKLKKPSPAASVNTEILVEAPNAVPAPRENTAETEVIEFDGNPKSTIPAKPRPEGMVSSKPQDASAESTPAASGMRRSKLDLGAGRRMLFGALGMKNPKSKQDEERLRNNLMKGVKPLLTPKSIDEPNPIPDEIINEDPDAWKANIIYRAVECVQEGIELSEPPFPFRQRWDPQQQNGRGDKRKKDQSQFHEDTRPSKKQKRRKGKQSHREEHEYWNEHLDLSYDDNYDTNYDESTQLSISQSHDVEGGVTEKFMDNVQDPAEAISQIPDDLAPLPQDMTSLADLPKGAAKVGITIAFKCLEMSEATKWQPKISPYRTAIVISVAENGELQLSLALRDRVAGKAYDEETGERIYGKFEMPDDDDEMDDGDDGIVRLFYGDLVEPKVVQEAPTNLSTDVHIEEALEPNEQPKVDTSATMSNERGSAETQLSQPEAQLSHVTETPLNSDAPDQPEFIQIEKAIVSAPVQKLGDEIDFDSAQHTQNELFDSPVAPLAVATDAIDPVTPGLRSREILTAEVLTPSEQISNENRQRISHMIKDAGFRSSIPSSIMKGFQPETPGDAAAFERLMRDMGETPQETPYSPKFNGFDSSPPNNEAEIQLDTDNLSPVVAVRVTSSDKVLQSSWETLSPRLEIPTSNPPSVAQSQASNPIEHIDADDSDDSLQSVTSPTSESIEQKPARKIQLRKVPIAKAQLVWEQLQPNSKRTSTHSASESEEISQATSVGFDTSDGKHSNPSVNYPKLSVGSSFTSQITDHGRQPDFDSDDNASLSSDSPFPSLAVLSQQSQALKQENAKSVEPRESGDTTEVKTVAMAEDERSNYEITQKPSRPQINSEKASSKVNAPPKRKNLLPASQPQRYQAATSKSSTSQFRHIHSQPIDLTQSSDFEEDPELEPKPTKRPKKIDLVQSGNEDDDDYEEKTGWVPKKNNIFNISGGRRQTGTNIIKSSLPSLNARRKATGK